MEVDRDIYRSYCSLLLVLRVFPILPINTRTIIIIYILQINISTIARSIAFLLFLDFLRKRLNRFKNLDKVLR